MGEAEHSRSPELDQVRRMLFPNLSEEDGWARIDAAFEGASDPERVEAIERLADTGLDDDLAEEVRRLRGDH